MSKLINSGEYDLQKFGIVKQNQFIDLSLIFYDIVLFESIFDASMSGIATIVDTNDIRTSLPLVGGEQIVLQFSTAGSDNDINYVGVVYKYSAIEKVNAHSSSYSIFFYSQEVDNSLKTYCEKPYSGVLSDIAKKIFNDISVDKKLIVEPTIGIHNYVCTRTRPLETIASLCSKSISSISNNGYVFYEDNSNWNFCTIEKLYQQEPITYFYTREESTFKDVKQRTTESFQVIQNIEFDKDESHFDRLVDGQLGIVSDYYDFITKKVVRTKYNKQTNYNPIKSLGNFVSQEKYDVGDYSYEFRTGIEPIEEKDAFKNKMAILGSKSFSATISVYGDSSLKVGACCSITLPNYVQGPNINENKLNGKFLISGIKHVLNKRTYAQQLTITKDAYNSI